MSYRTTPDPTQKRMPGGIPYILGNEVAERFSFYGMKAILTVFMTQHLLNASGNPDLMSEERAKTVYHLFTAGAYFFPIIGAILSDVFLGKYRTILFISLMYCVGHGCLAVMDFGPVTGLWDMKPWLFAGLILIAVGAGGIKPCVSAHVGDQFGTGNKHLITQVFNWFYFAINLGAAASSLLTPVLLQKVGPWAAFGLPGLLMAIATFVFWLGRHRFIHVQPVGVKQWVAETFSPEGKRALLNLAPLFLIFVPVFWAIFDQTGSAWVLQGDKMNRQLGILWLPSQIQAVNPILILTGIPIFTYLIYPLMGKFFEPTPLRKIGIGLVLTAFSFCVSAMIERNIEGKQDAIAATMFTELAADVRAGYQPNDGATQEEIEELPLQWSRAAVSAAQVSKWSNTDIADFFDIDVDPAARTAAAEANPDASSEDLESDLLAKALIERLENEQAFTPTQVAAMFTALATGDGPKKGSINGAIIGARNAKADARWDKGDKRVSSYLKSMPNIAWQFLAYIILTSGEILVSIVCLEFAYTQSPKKMKSFIMGVYFLGVSLGNFYVSGVNIIIDATRAPDGSTPLDGANYYWFFAGLMGVAWLIYLVWSKTYKGETFIQGEDTNAAEAEAEGPDAR